MVVSNGFLFRKDKSRITTINWRCVQKNCLGRLTTSVYYKNQDPDIPFPIIHSGNHSHSANPGEICLRKIKNKCVMMKPSKMEYINNTEKVDKKQDKYEKVLKWSTQDLKLFPDKKRKISYFSRRKCNELWRRQYKTDKKKRKIMKRFKPRPKFH